MPHAPIPTKTPLGQEAVRRRTGELGQRHRTILFLIDGRRTLAEVLGLAHQAGAATTHFEDLVRLGYVQMPAEAPEPEALPEPPAAGAEPQITHLEVEVPSQGEDPGAPADAPVPVPPAAPAVKAFDEAVPVFADTLPTPPPELPPTPAPPPAPPAPAPRPAPTAVPKASAKPRSTPARPAPPPALEDEDAPLIERTRACLLEALRVDPQPAGNRIAERARRAVAISDLIEVVWVMERGLTHSQRSHRGLLNLQKARELLGLGNTLVDEDSRPGIPDDDDW